MSWISTRTGRRFDYLNPTPDMISIDDIALGLSKECRYLGQCEGFYSVAQHSVLGARFVHADFQLEMLLHDAAEAYTGDCPTPFKRLLPDFMEFEARIDAVIRERFGLPPQMSAEVKWMDEVLYATERRDLTPEFRMEPGMRSYGVDPLPGKPIVPWGWRTSPHARSCAR